LTTVRPHDPTEFGLAVHDVLSHIPRGVVVSYGWVADEAGFPGAARAVGAYLRSDHDAPNWWRVVAANGNLVSPNSEEQARRLRDEGAAVQDGRLVDRLEHPGRR